MMSQDWDRLEMRRRLSSERSAEAKVDPEVYRRRTAAKLTAQQSEDLRPHAVAWDSITMADAGALQAALRDARDERPLQVLLQERPRLLVQHMGGGHGRWVVPRVRQMPDGASIILNASVVVC